MKKLKFNEGSSTLNFISNLCAFFITYSISFFLSPYIVKTLGADAYGFVSLANNFTNYISLATVAINSLASRFISVEIFKGDTEKAQKYYTSVIISNMAITAVLLIPCTFFIIFLEKFISIPTHLIFDVKILFAIIFASFFISLLTSLFNLAVFVNNKLHLTALHRGISSVIRLVLTIALFVIFPANIFFCGLVTLITNIYIICWQKHYMNKYLPEFKVNLRHFDIKKVFELIKSGIWSLVSQISGLLANGFDLLLTNQFIDSIAMGVLSISATLPSLIHSVMGSVSSAFTPNLTKYYANNEFDKMLQELRKSFKMMSVVLIVPMAGLAAFGDCFYALWQPTQDAQLLQIISILKIATLTFTGCTAAVHEIFIVANKLRPQAIATLVTGTTHFVLAYLLLKTTNLGIFSIVGFGFVTGILQNFTFTFVYAAKCIKQKWYTFHLLSLKAFSKFLIITGFFYLVKIFIYTPNNWISFIIVCLLSGAVAFIVNMYITLNKEERAVIINKLFGKFIKRRKV